MNQECCKSATIPQPGRASKRYASMTSSCADRSDEDAEVIWHREQVAKNRALIDELEAGNVVGGDVFPETQAEIDRLKAQVEQSELIIAAYEKLHGQH
jgi:hypothetical protein